jgi:RNA polymerase sigma factor (sigma-70 family)
VRASIPERVIADHSHFVVLAHATAGIFLLEREAGARLGILEAAKLRPSRMRRWPARKPEEVRSMVRDTWTTVLRDVDRLYIEGTSAGLSDEQLLSRFATAREQSDLAFESIVQRHGPMVLEVCSRLLGADHHAAEDAFQATFLVLARRARSITVRPGGSLGPWLHEVAWRTARKARVASSRRQAREQRVATRAEAVAQTDEPAWLADDRYRVLHEEVSRLPEKYRAAIVLCYFEGLTHDQAAASLGWPVGTVRGYLARARDSLRSRLIGRGVAPAVAVSLLNSRRTAATLAPPLVNSALRAIANGSVGSTVAALTGSIVRRQAIFRAGRTLGVVLAFALGAGGLGWVGSQLVWPAVRQVSLRQKRIAVAQPPASRGYVDLDGDPLPDGAVARLGTNRFNHAENVYRVNYTPDGKSIISYGVDDLARVWDATTGRLLRSIGERGSRGSRLFALSPDGKRIMSADRSADGVFRLWDFETGRELHRTPIPEPRRYFSLMSYSPDSKTLATALFDDAICLRDVETLSELRRIKVVTRSMGQLVFSPDGRMLAGTSLDQDPQFGRRPAAGATAHPDASEKASIRIWDVGRGDEVRRLTVEGCHTDSFSFSPDGRILAAPFCDATIRFYDPAAGNELGRVKVDGPMQSAIAFSPDGKLLASGGSLNRGHAGDVAEIHIWDVARRAEVRRIPTLDTFINGLAFSPDGKRLASTLGKMIHLWDVDTGREINTASSHRSSVACMVVSPADGSVITGGYDNAIRKWDAASGRELAVIGSHPRPVCDLAISPDGRFLLSCSIDATIHLRDMNVGQELPRILVGNPKSRGRGLAFSPDGRLATASGKIWEVVTGREHASLLDEKGEPFEPWGWACFTPDDTSLVATDGGAIWLWDVTGGRPVRQIAAPGFQIMSVALSPDGRFLAAGVNDAVRLWHLASGREINVTIRHDARYVVAAFSPDGRLLVSGCGYDMTNDDPSVRVWEVASGAEIRRYDGHRAGVYSVAFFSDGHRIASSSADATAMVWDAMQPAPANRAASPVPLDLERLWADLNEGAARAYQAIWALVAEPERAVPFLADRVEPVKSGDPEKDVSLGPLAHGETLRRLRAIAVAEKIGTPEARKILQRLALGFEGARETRDARASLRRLGARSF